MLSEAQQNDQMIPNQPGRKHRYWIPVSILALVGILVIVQMIFSPKKPAQPERVYTIGVMRYLKALEKIEEGFYQGMQNLGYVEGKNVRYIITPYGDSPAQMQGIAQGLIDQNVDLIMAITNVAATGAKKATEASGRTDIPIIFANANKPDATGLIQSFRSSGNNLTGVAVDFVQITGKKLEFLQKINPAIKRIGAFDAVNTDPAGKFVLEELQSAASKLGLEVVIYKLEKNIGPESVTEITAAANKIRPGDLDAFFFVPGPVLNPPTTVKIVADMAQRLHIPVAYQNASQVTLQGGLFSYDPNLIIMGNQTAVFTHKVLKGQRPSDIPVEFPTKNNLTINLVTAKASGITIPETMLLIADTKIDK